MRKIIAVLTASIFVFAHSFAQDAPTESSPAVPVFAMSIEEGALVGPGADVINGKLEKAQFILIGEDHGFAGPPQIARAIAKAAWPYGLRYHVVEAGPIATDWAADILRRDGVEGLATALEGRPLALPFLNQREDAELAKYFLDNRGALWGIDQEFIGSSVIHLERLETLARGSAAKEQVAKLLEVEQNALATGNQGALFLFAASENTFSTLEAHFSTRSEALEIITALRESAAIYQAYGRGKYFKSNTDRVTLLKAQFIDHYRDARQRTPRVLFKMGNVHLARGTTQLNTFDIGSLTQGVAAANGMSVLRLLVNPLEGAQMKIRPSPDGFFSVADYQSKDVAEMLTMMGIVANDIPVDGWVVISLEPLRLQLGQKGLNKLSREVRAMILGYDYLITTRGAKAATPLVN